MCGVLSLLLLEEEEEGCEFVHDVLQLCDCGSFDPYFIETRACFRQPSERIYLLVHRAELSE